MVARRFDALVGEMTGKANRRGALRSLVASGVALISVAGGRPDQGEAKNDAAKKRRQKEKQQEAKKQAQVEDCLTIVVPYMCPADHCGKYCGSCRSEMSRCCYQYSVSRESYCSCLYSSLWGQCIG
jgi:hypothetical protein